MGSPTSGLWGSTIPGGAPATLAGQVLVSDVLYTALRIAGILSGPGRGASAADTSDAFLTLNTMLDAWNVERLAIHAIRRDVYSLIAGQQDYTIGTGGNFDTTRPVKIDAAGLISLSNPAQPLERPLDPLTVERWAAIPLKSVASLPMSFYYETAYPLGIVHLWPLPSSADQIALYVWRTNGVFAAPVDSVILAPGYLRAIQYNLAVELALRWPERAKLSPLAIEIASDSKAAIKRLNTPLVELVCDPGVLGRGRGVFDWRTGE